MVAASEEKFSLIWTPTEIDRNERTQITKWMKMKKENTKSNKEEGVSDWEEKKKKNTKCCPPESKHAEGQHLLRIMGTTLEEFTCVQTPGYLLVHISMKLNSVQRLLSVFVNKALSGRINSVVYHAGITGKGNQLDYIPLCT